MGRTIKFTYNDKDYTLEYCRKTAQMLEARGLVISEVINKPVSNVPLLFEGAFQMHHGGTSRKLVSEIFDVIADKDELTAELIAMYNETVESMLDTASKGKVSWTAEQK